MTKNKNVKIFIVVLTAALTSCSNQNSLSGKTSTRTIPGVAARGSLPDQLSSNDGTAQTLPPAAVKGTDPFVGSLPDPAPNFQPAPITSVPQNNPPEVPNVAQPHCSGVVINNACQPIKAIHRCRSNFDTAFYTNHIYVAEASECNRANYVFEATPYFYALPAMDKTLIRWYRTGLSGSIQHYYLQPGETTPPSYPLTYEGPSLTISANDFNHPRKVALYRCRVNCAVLGLHPRCDGNMQWISTDVNCEGNGVGPGQILGYGITP